ncbi:hypothetical protein DSECCO2_428960 [anaerobic digester metagenome]
MHHPDICQVHRGIYASAGGAGIAHADVGEQRGISVFHRRGSVEVDTRIILRDFRFFQVQSHISHHADPGSCTALLPWRYLNEDVANRGTAVCPIGVLDHDASIVVADIKSVDYWAGFAFDHHSCLAGEAIVFGIFTDVTVDHGTAGIDESDPYDRVLHLAVLDQDLSLRTVDEDAVPSHEWILGIKDGACGIQAALDLQTGTGGKDDGATFQDIQG